MIIAKNIYSIKYLKKNRRAGKQLEKVLKSSADRVILRPCLAERWVITHETPLQAFANLGQLPSVWSGETCIGKGKRKGNTMTVNTKEIQEQGGRLGDVLPRIELVRQLSNSLIMAKNNGADTAILSGQMAEGLAVIRDQMEQLYRELDGIAVYLLNCENFEELGYKSDENSRCNENDSSRN